MMGFDAGEIMIDIVKLEGFKEMTVKEKLGTLLVYPLALFCVCIMASTYLYYTLKRKKRNKEEDQ